MIFKTMLVLAGGWMAYRYFKYKNNQLKREQEAISLSQDLSARAQSGLASFQHYMDSYQPKDISDELLSKGLIMQVGSPKACHVRYGLTRMGAAVGHHLGLFSKGALLTPFD